MSTAILFIHGFMGMKKQFESFAQPLAGIDADLYFHTLPGHEASLEEFRRSTARLWQESVDNKLSELSGEYDRLVLVGHSMGGLLAVSAAAKHPDKVAGIVAVGFPVKINLSREWLGLMTSAAKPERPGEDPRVTAARNMAGVRIKGVGQYFSTLPQNLHFLATTRRAAKALGVLKPPLTVINFEHDEITAPSVPDFVRKKLPEAEAFVLPASYHFLFDGEEEKFIIQKIMECAG